MFIEKIVTKIGYIEITLPFSYYNQLLQNINENPPTEPYNENLAGQIENEKGLNLSLIPEEVKQIINQGCHEYINIFGHNKFKDIRFRNKKYKLELLDSWINFQKAGEYNPIHNHDRDLVYVIWLQIPYNLEDEINHPSSKKSNNIIASKFQFASVNNSLSNTMNNIININKSYEGKMIIFHGQMEHCVYPFFTSDDYRISMSGNLDIVLDA